MGDYVGFQNQPGDRRSGRRRRKKNSSPSMESQHFIMASSSSLRRSKNDDGTSHRSCMPMFQKQKSKSTSSTVPLTEQSDLDWDDEQLGNQQPLLVSPNQQVDAAWKQPIALSGTDTTLDTSPPSSLSSSNVQPQSHLLTLPTPTYRGRGKRRELYSNDSNHAATNSSSQQLLLRSKTTSSGRHLRRSPVYEGEQEPEGIRGQEATVENVAATPQTLPSMRSFGQQQAGNDLVISPLTEETSSLHNGYPADSYQQFCIVDHDSSSSEHEEESTESSIDIQRMRTDLLPSPRQSPPLMEMSNTPHQAQTQNAVMSRPHLVQDDNDVDSTDSSSSQEGGGYPMPYQATAATEERSLEHDQQETWSDKNQGSVLYESLLTTSSAAPSSDTSSNDSDDSQDSDEAVFMEKRQEHYRVGASPRAPISITASAARRRQLQAERLKADAEETAIDKHTQPQKNQVVHVEELHAAAVRHVELGEYNHALGLFEMVLQIYIETHGRVHPLVASTRHNLGLVHSKRANLLMDGEYRREALTQALKNFQAAARCARDSLGSEHPNVAASLVRIGFLLMDCKEYNKAVITFEEALRIRLAHYGPQHALVANLYNDLGVCHTHVQQWKDAMNYTKSALLIQRNLIVHFKQGNEAQDDDKMQLEVADTLCNLGGLYLEKLQHDHDGCKDSSLILLEWARHAVSSFSEALDIRMFVIGQASHPLVIQARSLHDMAQTSLRELQKHKSKKNTPPPLVVSPSKEDVFDEDDLSSRFFQHNQEPKRDDDSSFEIRRGAFTVPNADYAVPEKKKKSKRRSSSSSLPLEEVTVDPDNHVEEFLDADSLDGVSPLARRVPDGSTKIWVSPHVIPTRSPPRDLDDEDSDGLQNLSSFSLFDDYSSQQNDIMATPDNDNGAYQRKRERTYSYDAEESCLIGSNAEKQLTAFPPFEDEAHDSKREIMVVQPTNTFDEKAVQPLVSRKTISWAQAVSQNQQQDAGNGLDSPTWTMVEQDSMFEFQQNKHAAGNHHGGSAEADSGGGPASLSSPKEPSQPQHVQRPIRMIVTRQMMEEPESHLESIHAAATRYLRENRLHESIILFETILTCQKQKHGELHEEVGSALHNVGLVHLRAERHAEALDAFEKAVRVRKGALGRDHPDVAVSLVKVGITQLLLHRFEMALMAFRDALSIRRHSLGSLHPSLARIYSNIGCVHLEFNELREARRAFEGALDIQRNALCEEPDSGPLMFGTATTLCNLGYLYKSRDMHGKAAVIFKEAVNLQEVVLGSKHPTVLSTLDTLADSNTKCNNCATALKCYYDILERFPPVEEFGSRAASLIRRKRAEAVILYKMSRVHRKQNDRESELEKLHASLDIVQEIVGNTSHNNRELSERLERGIQRDIKRVQDDIAKSDLEWV